MAGPLSHQATDIFRCESVNTRARSLQVVVLAPVLILMLVAGAVMYAVVLRTVSEFADESIRANLAALSRSAFRLADSEVDRQVQDGLSGDQQSARMYQLDARVRFEDFARAHDVALFVLVGGKLDFATRIETAVAQRVAEHMPSTSIDRMSLSPDSSVYVQPVEFAPWKWRIVLVKDADAFQALIAEVRTIYVGSAALLLVVTALLVIWLRQVLVRPIDHIASAFAAGRAPDYEGVRELEVLADRIGGVMRSLNEKTLHLQTTLASMSDGIAVYDKDMKLVAWNEQYARLYGYPAALLQVGTDFSDVMRFNVERGDYGPGDPDAQHAEMVQRARLINPPRFEIDRPDGTTLETRRARMPGGGFVTTYTDVTDRKQAARLEVARRKAEAANEAKAVFLRDISHDLRKPVNAVIEYASLVAEQTREKLTERERRNVNHISASARHLRDVIDAILDMARIDAGQVQVHAVPVDVGALVERCTQVVGAAAGSKGLDLSYRVEDREPVVSDPHLLSRILMNLLDNAIKYTNQGKVDLRIWREEEKIGFAVQDTGTGIKEGDIAAVFEKFHRLEPTSGMARAGVGLGLGLAISREFARLLGGDIEVVSKPGVGSTFTFRMPAAFAEVRTGEYGQ